MNIFRFIADMLHLGAILVLLYRIKNTRNCIGKNKLQLNKLTMGTLMKQPIQTNDRKEIDFQTRVSF